MIALIDQLKRSDPQLRLLAAGVGTGLFILLAGLWWVQIVSARDYQSNLQTQSFRTVRTAAVRGAILDRHGVPLAENRPVYNVCLYFEELRGAFDKVYTAKVSRMRAELKAAMLQEEKRLGRKLTATEKKPFGLSVATKNRIRQEARYEAASNLVHVVGLQMQEPLQLDPARFHRHYQARLFVPFPILSDLNERQVARFLEQSSGTPGVDLDVQTIRVYPHGNTAAHIIGYLKRDDSSVEGEESYFSYRNPDYRGLVGVEAGFDKHLRGRAGAKSILVNNLGYRQTENVWSRAEPGQTLRLTIDFQIQQLTERVLPALGPETRGAAVVMDVHSGDIVAMASSPALNPNHFIHGFPAGEIDRLNDPKLRPLINRATQENYPPGSIFKPLVGLAALEAGLDPTATYYVQPDPFRPQQGCIFVGKRKIEDLAEPGNYDFKRALLKSSNAYFITNGLRYGGIEAVIALCQRFALGQRVGLPTWQETSGIVPTPEQLRSGWSDGDTANICIGQGYLAVTPIQMAVMTAAIANGGKVLVPRLVDRLEPTGGSDGTVQVFPSGKTRGRLNVSDKNLNVIRRAMLADVEDPEGTGTAAAVPGYRVSGKTGTAEVMNARNQLTDRITWFVSFAPFESPKYAVVVMVESGRWGGSTCAPIARQIYTALRDRDRGGQVAVAVDALNQPSR